MGERTELDYRAFRGSSLVAEGYVKCSSLEETVKWVKKRSDILAEADIVCMWKAISSFVNRDYEIVRLIVAGGRDFDDEQRAFRILESLMCKFPYMTIIEGGARGADAIGKKFAKMSCLDLESMPADWGTHGKAAGYMRNEDMAKCATHCLCFWDGKSKGTKHMIDLAKKYKLKLKVVRY